MCLDMDAFFASVEQQSNPKLRGKPIAVLGSGGRTVITTRSYEARKYGVKTGMNIYEAKKVCPHIIVIVQHPPPPNPFPPGEGAYLSADLISSLPLDGGGLGWG